MGLLISFGKLDVADENVYVMEKLSAFFGNKKSAKKNAEIVCRRSKFTEIPLESSENFPLIDKAKEQALRDGKACILNEVKGRFVLAENESILDDFFSYTPYLVNGIPAGTPVLRRTTNQGVIYFIDLSASIGHFTAFKPTSFIAGIGGVAQITSKALVSLASAFGSSMGKTVGLELINSILGNTSQMSTAELCDELAKIVKNANTEQTIEETSGRIDANRLQFVIDYKNKKESGYVSDDNLTGLLDDISKGIYECLGILCKDMFKEKGLSVFIYGANLLFAIKNEQAELEAKMNNKQIKATSSYNTYIDYKKVYLAHVKEMKDIILPDRLSKVTGITSKQTCNGGNIVVCSTEFSFTDKFTGKSYSHSDGYDNKNKDTQARQKTENDRKVLINQLKSELSWIDETIGSWGKIA